MTPHPIRTMLASAAVAFVGSAALACTPTAEFTTVNPGQLTVGVVSVPPIITLVDGKLGGFEGAVLNRFAEENCLEVNGVEIAGAGIIPAVESHRVDLATGGWARTIERAKIIDFSHPTLLSKMAVIANKPIGSYAELKSLRLGTPQGNRWVPEAQAYYGDALTIYQSFDQVFNDLKVGRLEAAIVPFELGEAWVASLTGFQSITPPGIPEIGVTMNEPQVGFPMPKGNDALRAALDASIIKMHENGVIAAALTDNGMSLEIQSTGEPRLVP